MNYNTLREIINLLEEFEAENLKTKTYSDDVEGFKKWTVINYKSDENSLNEPYWEGKENGRSPESAIATLIVHMNRYGRSYSKSAIFGSDFSTQEDFSYLINLKAFGEMTKMDLIKKNVHEKPTGMQIINRLIAQGWVNQTDCETDKRSKVLKITHKGLEILDNQMGKIREATQIISGDLTYNEKMELIRLLNKLNDFHLPIFNKNIASGNLLNEVLNEKK